MKIEKSFPNKSFAVSSGHLLSYCCIKESKRVRGLERKIDIL
jgi:hypothetical protein